LHLERDYGSYTHGNSNAGWDLHRQLQLTHSTNISPIEFSHAARSASADEELLAGNFTVALV